MRLGHRRVLQGFYLSSLLVTCGALSSTWAQAPYVCADPYDVTGGDADSDGVRDECDCAPSNSSAFFVPTEAMNLSIDSGSLLEWVPPLTSPGTALAYDIVRGDLADLRAGNQTTESCLADDTIGLSVLDTEYPPIGVVWFYLVRVDNACGAGHFNLGTSHGACTRTAGTPEIVTGVSTTPAGTDLVVSWQATPGAIDYSIYRIGPTPSAEEYGDCLASGILATSYTDVGILAGTRPLGMTYIVVARNGVGESSLGWVGSGVERRRAGPPCP